MELRRLRYFVAVAEELHFTRAAGKLHMAQPALSHQIGELERELGVRLLVRTERSVALTEAGRLFLDHARRVLDEVAVAERVAKRAGRGEVGRLAVGFVPPAAGDLFPAAVRAYMAAYPDVEVFLTEQTSAAQIEGLLGGGIQVGLVHRVTPHDRIQLEPLRLERFAVAMPVDHARAQTVSLRELAEERWIIGPRTVPDSLGFSSTRAPRWGSFRCWPESRRSTRRGCCSSPRAWGWHDARVGDGRADHERHGPGSPPERVPLNGPPPVDLPSPTWASRNLRECP